MASLLIRKRFKFHSISLSNQPEELYILEEMKLFFHLYAGWGF